MNYLFFNVSSLAYGISRILCKALVFHAIDVLKEEEEEEENVIFVSNNIYNYVTMNVTETSWFDN